MTTAGGTGSSATGTAGSTTSGPGGPVTTSAGTSAPGSAGSMSGTGDGTTGADGSPSTGQPSNPDGTDGGSDTPQGFQVFLLFGQSNMEGVPPAEAQDLVVPEGIEVLGYTNCGGRTYNQWAPAVPPLHSCGLGLGPGDYFARTVAEAWPDATIGLVPAAIAGVDLDFYVKGIVSGRRNEFQIPPDNTSPGAYAMMLEKALLAQERGPIRGILFHQGESDSGSPEWLGKVAGIVADLKQDLDLPDDIPFIAGELLYSGCCAGHNTLVNQIPSMIPNARVATAEGLAGIDDFHFDVAGQRELGRRYAEAFLEAFAAQQ